MFLQPRVLLRPCMCLLAILWQVAGGPGVSCRSPLTMLGVGETDFLLVLRDLVRLEWKKYVGAA